MRAGASSGASSPMRSAGRLSRILGALLFAVTSCSKDSTGSHHAQESKAGRAMEVSATVTAVSQPAFSGGGKSSFSRHSFLFMGGLQRSGTTWLESLVASPRVSGLSFDNVDLAAYRQQQPWLLQNHTQEYFEMVVRSGGVEGKFVQDAYPYVYLVRDVGRHGRVLENLLIDARAASPQTAEQLFNEWSLFWDTSRPVLLEKTPENLLMGPYLQAAFGPSTTRFAFVMRHPLVWALAIEKWIFPDFAELRTVEDRVAFWFECMSRAVEHLPQLRNAIVLQLETASASPELQRAIAGRLLCTADERTSSNQSLPDVSGESTEILSSSLAYVSCWLSGMEFKSSLRRCVPRKAFRDPALRQQPEQLALDTRWRLRQLARQREAQANQFGYTFRPFVALARKQTPAVLRERVAIGQPAFMAGQLGVTQHVSTVRPVLRPFLAVLPPSSPPQNSSPPPPAELATRPGVILVYHKMGFDRDRPSGMDLRMTQILSSLISLRHTVHFVCHCDVHASQLAPFEANVVIYTGTLQEQFTQAAAAAVPLRSVLIFFTTLTMSVHQRMLQGEAGWYTEPKSPLPEEQVLSWVRARPGIQACTVAVADDIHYLRAIEVMERHDAAKARLASEWIRRRELGFHSAVDGTATVSLEDAETLKGALAGHAPALPRTPRCTSGCACSMTWVPYIQATRSESSIEPFERRHEGMLYVGGMHGLAIIAIEWLLQKVQPLIGSTSKRGEVELQRGGKGHLHLAGPGWAQHAAESRVLNQSVSAGHATILGTLSDMQLDQRLQDHKVFVAPVLNGTGIATKNVLAMAHGIPLVTTVTGLNGLGLPLDQKAILVADSPSGFANHVLNVQSSERVFNVTWRAAMEHTRTYLSADRQRAQICRIIGCSAQPSPPAALSRPQETRTKLCDAAGSKWPLLRASEAVTAPTRSGTPVVLLGIEGTNVSALALAMRSPRVCIMADPLQGLMRAPMQAQVDHLQSLLAEPNYCQGFGQEADHAESSHLLLQGFAIELPRVERVATSMLASASGLEQLARILTAAKAKVVIVRRCSPTACALGQLLPPPAHCSAGTCGASGHHATRLDPLDVVREAGVCVAQDEALRVLLEASNIESTHFFLDERAGHSALTGQMNQLKSFLKLPHAHQLVSANKAVSSVTDGLASAVENAKEIEAQLGASGVVESNCSSISGSRTTAFPPSLRTALTTLASRTRPRRPIIVVGAHGIEGGASLMGKVLAEACREYLSPSLGWRCVVRDGYDTCDPEADVCFQRQAHFSPGRYADRGYRFIHLIRSPLDVLTRSYQLLDPNSTHTMNSTALLVALEAHWKTLSTGVLHEMQDIAESHSADPRALRIRLEDLMPESNPNTTLASIFAFLLDADGSSGRSRPHALRTATEKALLAAGRAEQQGDTQRKHLSKLLLRKPAKCQHVNRLLQPLGYSAMPCTEGTSSSKSTAPAGSSSSGGGDASSAGERRTTRKRRSRRLMEVDAPRPRRWRLAAAWV